MLLTNEGVAAAARRWCVLLTLEHVSGQSFIHYCRSVGGPHQFRQVAPYLRELANSSEHQDALAAGMCWNDLHSHAYGPLLCPHTHNVNRSHQHSKPTKCLSYEFGTTIFMLIISVHNNQIRVLRL
ncbi:hypothetical protein MPTK1_1g25780 [Marchantia polymorpha subsp. ruderalis]|uniref:Uncharacterized protein n=2 Tax=Marchantia polymorpha TaxID=3197 RepID=A0AAF6AU99_MARPO|nr:hypothetical protein MARPO_0002s0298 [Marchantia polymorpha]BBN00020.1 hypothetical protein Mp_1g25780 [Marchantia polymorpha subsp. ruderalis]|eukprot:PTQ49863.1 hypothetical protein MARPO_0002s0298 [Marchantia polymorpha]